MASFLSKIVPSLCCVLSCLMVCPASTDSVAATAAPAPAQAAAQAKVDGKTYKLGAQDVISVAVANYPQYSSENVPVLPDGSINLPFYGQVKASGKTILQLQKELQNILGRRFRKPELLTVSIVTVRPAEVVKPLTVSILGAVEKPGSTVIAKGERLAQVIASAGGTKARLEEVQASLVRPGEGSIPLNLLEAMQRPTSPANVVLKNGDTVTLYAPEPGRVVVSGDVARPGVFEMHRMPRFGTELSMLPRLLDVLVVAGGVKGAVASQPTNPDGNAKEIDPNAPPGNSQNNAPNVAPVPVPVSVPVPLSVPAEPAQFTGFLLRQGEKIALQINEVLEAKDQNSPLNVPILPGDFLTIEYVPPKPPKPPVMLTVYVEGSATRQPGAFVVPEGTRLLEVIARSGGLAKPLAETRVSLRRVGSTNIVPINLQNAYLNDNAQTNPALQNGDILMVREPDTIEVQVTGQFAKPSTLQLPVGTRLNEAIAASGGLTIAPRETQLSIVRRRADGNQLALSIDLVALLDKHDLAQNARLEMGDWISATQIPTERKASVLISGEVTKGGPYEITEGNTLPQVVALAGGTTSEALLSDVVVQRDEKVYSVDVYDAITLGLPSNFPLKDGDFVVVKKNPNRVMVLESVAKPGPVIMPEKRPMTLQDALNAAGGAQPNANKKAITLLRRLPDDVPLQPGAVRPEGTTENVQAFTFSLDKNAAAALNTELKAGDVIYVPSQTQKSGFSLKNLLPFVTLFRLF